MLELPDIDGMYSSMAKGAKIERAHVTCRKCGTSLAVDGARALRHGWPKCCGETMMLGAATEVHSR